MDAVMLVVFRQVAVEQIQGDMAGFGLPDLERDRRPVRLTCTLRLACRCHRWTWVIGSRAEIGGLVMGDLIAVAVDGLGEVALPVQYPDRNKRDAEVAGGLAVIARQDAEAAGINGQTFMKAEFGAEIGDQILLGIEIALE